MTEIRDEGNLLTTRGGCTAQVRSSHQLSSTQPAGQLCLAEGWPHLSNMQLSGQHFSVTISNLKEKITVGSKKWSHKPHPDHRQCLAYATYKLKTFFNKTDLSNAQNKILPIPLLHQIYSFWDFKYYEMTELAELKVYKIIIYQTSTLYINISETDLQYTVSLYSLSNCSNVISVKLKAAKRSKVLWKGSWSTFKFYLSHLTLLAPTSSE